jgi:hypothetical protein
MSSGGVEVTEHDKSLHRQAEKELREVGVAHTMPELTVYSLGIL